MRRRQVVEKLALTVGLDDELTDIDMDSTRTIGDVIKHALVSFDMEDQDPEECHLALQDRLFFPNQPLASSGLESGTTLRLRLPL